MATRTQLTASCCRGIDPAENDEWKLVKRYLKNTHGPTHTEYSLRLKHVWKVEREEEARRYRQFEADGNRMLLWHGSRTTNFAGILSQGLRIAPPEAPATGYMFGKGVVRRRHPEPCVSSACVHCNMPCGAACTRPLPLAVAAPCASITRASVAVLRGHVHKERKLLCAQAWADGRADVAFGGGAWRDGGVEKGQVH